ncbi:tetraspanin-19 [Olea europaea subsp. europaea]|uniref:Tetraspanin-19 n=1 Tax=Olea europaea subsp. europaea TaxID=158383 RepID=A0A8S0TVB0_OLEEU|nr:tetraspanin-19 [Olea europaea subsp. europaea]
MARIARNCIQSMLKVVNSGIGMVGIAMIIYCLWMLRAWNRHLDPSDNTVPWFIYTILGIGVTLCVITCSGHIAGETANGCCLCIYMVFVFLLLLVEAAVAADVFLNHNWEENFPDDPTRNFNQLKDFVTQNFDICKWIVFTVVVLEGLSMLMAIILKALGPYPGRDYGSDDDFQPERLPLLKNYVPPPPRVAGDQIHGTKNDSSITRINSKMNKILT